MAKRKGANINDTWSHIFNAIGSTVYSEIEKNGHYDITADRLREFSAEVSGPDVRNLAKFDKSAKLPDVFKLNTAEPKKRLPSEEYINILPLGNVQSGEYTYRLGRFNAYAHLDVDLTQKPTTISYPDIETITPSFISEKGISENTYIDLAVTSGMLDEAFNSTGDKLMPVMHGRLRSGEMTFQIGRNQPQSITTGSNQLEVDATFENSNSIVIIEAKAVPEQDFFIRQLYYPYYVINHRGVSKRIRPTFLLLLEGTFYFNEYEFSDPDNYSTIKLINQRAFRFADHDTITISTIRNLIKTIPIAEEPDVPFPQANSRTQFVKTLSMLNESREQSYEQPESNGMTTAQISEELGYAGRQGAYYGDLSRYLGLATKEHGYYMINNAGQRMLSEFDNNAGRLSLIKHLLAHKPFRIAAEWYMNGHLDQAQSGKVTAQAKEEIGQQILDAGGLTHVDSKTTTFPRRIESTIALVRSSIFDVLDSE